MKITRKQLRRLIEMATVFPKNPVDYVSDSEQQKNIRSLVDSDDEMNQAMGYDLAGMLQDEGGYEGEDYLADLKSAQSKDRIDQMYAMIPGLYNLSQSNKPLHDKFVNTLLHPKGIGLWFYEDLNPQSGNKVNDSKIEKMYKDVQAAKQLPDYLFTDPLWEGHLFIQAILPNAMNQVLLTLDELYQATQELSKLSGLNDQVKVEFEILRFIHKFVKHKAYLN